jgi:multidomain signaling protein FimX
MPAPAPSVILLIMTSQPGEAERMITSLRNGGLSVRGMYTANADRIDELVERRACDMIICCSYDPEVDLNAVLARHRELDADCPLIVITDHDSEPQLVIKALSAGARDVTARDDVEHLQLVVGRELSDLQVRRQVRRLTDRLEECELHARELLESSEDAVAFIQDGMHIHANPAYLSLFRFAALDDLQAAAFLDLIAPEARPAARDFLRVRAAAEDQGQAEVTAICMRADASQFHATLLAISSELDGEPCLQVTVRETDRQSIPTAGHTVHGPEAQVLGHAALSAAIDAATDPTGRTAAPFALFCTRLRGVPVLVHDFGLTRAMAMVGSMAASLQQVCGGTVLLARLCDDGYGFVAPGCDDSAAETLAGRIRTEVRLPQPRAGKSPDEADWDLGYVVVSGPCPAPSDLIDEAWRTCCGSPAKGATKLTSLATRAKQPADAGDDAFTHKIEQALDHDRFMLVYQPIISLMGDSQENYSVLVRMLDESENLHEAKDFIGAAIRSGLIERIDKWAIRTAIKAVSEQRLAGQNLNFFINLAEDTFRDPGVIIWICDCLQEFNVRGSWLTFVIQEELVDGNLGSLGRFVESLKKIKCRVAINHFGATDHPQMILQGLSLDFILLLPAFAQGLADDKDKQNRLLALANLAREFNVRSVVTGVEDARALTILWTAGVDYVQGNFLQRPSPTLEISS